MARLADSTRRQPRKKALWVAIYPGKEEALPLPSLQDIAALSEGSIDEWARFVARYGLPEFDWKWAVTRLGEEYILRIPLSDLKETGAKAVVLVAARNAALGYPVAFQELGPLAPVAVFTKALDRKGPRPFQKPWKIRVKRIEGTEQQEPAKRPDPYEEVKRRLEESELAHPAEEARKIIALALEDSLDQMEADVEPGSRGIPEGWAFHARGCWPLVVLSEFVHKKGYVQYQSTTCIAPGCSNRVPIGRYRYCSGTCRERARKQRKRGNQPPIRPLLNGLR